MGAVVLLVGDNQGVNAVGDTVDNLALLLTIGELSAVRHTVTLLELYEVAVFVLNLNHLDGLRNIDVELYRVVGDLVVGLSIVGNQGGSQGLNFLVEIDLVVIQPQPNGLGSTGLERYDVVVGRSLAHVAVVTTNEEVVEGSLTNHSGSTVAQGSILAVAQFIGKSRKAQRCCGSKKK